MGGGLQRKDKCQIPLIYTVGFCCVGRLSALLFQFPVSCSLLVAFTPICTAESHLNLSKLRDTFQISNSDYCGVILYPNITTIAILTIKTTTLEGLSLHSLFAPFITMQCMAYFQPIHKNRLFVFVVLRSAQSKADFHSCFKTNPDVLEIHECLHLCKTKKTYLYTHFSFHVKWTL